MTSEGCRGVRKKQHLISREPCETSEEVSFVGELVSTCKQFSKQVESTLKKG